MAAVGILDLIILIYAMMMVFLHVEFQSTFLLFLWPNLFNIIVNLIFSDLL